MGCDGRAPSRAADRRAGTGTRPAPGPRQRPPAQLSGGQRQRVAFAGPSSTSPSCCCWTNLWRARVKAAQGDAALVEGHPARDPYHFPLRHPRPGGGDRDGRRRVMNQAHPAARRPERGLRAPASEFVARFFGVSNLIERDGRRVTIRPEKIQLLEEERLGAHGPRTSRRARSPRSTYLGVFTRYCRRARPGATLVAVRQNLEDRGRATPLESAGAVSASHGRPRSGVRGSAPGPVRPGPRSRRGHGAR